MEALMAILIGLEGPLGYSSQRILDGSLYKVAQVNYWRIKISAS
jgi:hypothetical protein